MAERYYTAASGNWSTTANWDGGTTLPGAGDDVYANGKTITIDQDITCLKITTAAGATAVSGGSFNVSTTRTINANIVAGTTNCLNLATSSTLITVNGNVTGGGNNAAAIVTTSVPLSVTVNGNVTAGSGIYSFGIWFLAYTSGAYGTCTVGSSGSPRILTGGSVTSSQSAAIAMSTAGGVLVVYGDVYGGTSGSNQYGIWVGNSCPITVYGSVYGGTSAGSGCNGILNQSGNDSVINGNVYGANSGTGNEGCNFNSSATLTVNGNVTAGTKCSGIKSTGTGAITVSGEAIANARGSGSSDALVWAIENTSTAVSKVGRVKCGTNGMWPISGPCFVSNLHQGSVKVKNSLLNEGIYELPRPKGTDMGDYQVGDVIYRHHTFRTTPASLTVAVYTDDSTTEITTGVTVTYSGGFDGVAGLVSVKVDTASGYTTGKDFTIVATGGTVFGDSIAGTVIGGFSLAKQSLSSAVSMRAVMGLASASLDTQLSTLVGYTDTVETALATIYAVIDTEVGAIKAKTDNLPSDPADASDIAASFAAVNSTLTTIAGYVDTEVTAVSVRAAVGLATANLDTQLSNMPTSVWNFDMLANIATTVNRYSPWNAMRHIIDKWAISSGTKTVYKEDGSTTAYTTTVTSDASGISGDTP